MEITPVEVTELPGGDYTLPVDTHTTWPTKYVTSHVSVVGRNFCREV